MNWFTQSVVSNQPITKKKALVQEWGGCDHVVADPALLHVVSYENDSFGQEGYCMCESCWTAAQAAEDEVEYVCEDCKQSVKLKDGRFWKWYDFSAAQGDEPLFICNTCRKGETHVNRVRQDRQDYEREFSDD